MENNRQLSLCFADGYADQNEEYLLISLKKEYYDKIRDGSKKYEYRRNFRRYPTTAFVYLTSPDKVVPGFIKFGHPIIGTPEEISRFAESQRAGHGSAVFEYLKGANESFAIPIKSLFEYHEPIHFDDIRKIDSEIVAPQSFIIVNKRLALLKFLMEKPSFNSVNNEDKDL